MSEIATVEAQPGEFAVIERAIASGTTPEALEKLIGLLERLHAAKAKTLYAQAMNSVQSKMPAIIKTKAGQNNKYPPLEDLVAIVTPVYTAEGFSLSFDTADCPLENHIRIVCDVIHAGGHTERKHFDLPVDGKGAQGGRSSMNAVQGHGSTISYGRRYLTVMIFNLVVAGEDTDAANYGRQEAEADPDLPQGKPPRMGSINGEQAIELANTIKLWEAALAEIRNGSPDDLNRLLPQFTKLKGHALARRRVWDMIEALAAEKKWQFIHADKIFVASSAKVAG